MIVGGLPHSTHAMLFLTCASFVPADIQILMGSLVYLRHGIENSPYRSLLETNQWAEICNIFTRDACALLGLSVESPLSVRLEPKNLIFDLLSKIFEIEVKKKVFFSVYDQV